MTFFNVHENGLPAGFSCMPLFDPMLWCLRAPLVHSSLHFVCAFLIFFKVSLAAMAVSDPERSVLDWCSSFAVIASCFFTHVVLLVLAFSGGAPDLGRSVLLRSRVRLCVN